MSTLPKVLQLVNKLQQICAKFNENAVTTGGGLPGLWDLLPAIVVVGGQSSGKSSVLEAIVGRRDISARWHLRAARTAADAAARACST